MTKPIPLDRDGFRAWLVERRACSDGLKWYDSDPWVNGYDVWQRCGEVEWLIWLASEVGDWKSELRLFACDCARQLPLDEENLAAVELAERFARGEAAEAERQEAVYRVEYRPLLEVAVLQSRVWLAVIDMASLVGSSNALALLRARIPNVFAQTNPETEVPHADR